MKAVLPAAGHSTRTWPITRDIPKPMLPILGTPIIGYTMGGLKDLIDEWLILLHPEDKATQEYLETAFPDLNIRFFRIMPDGTGIIQHVADELRNEEAFLILMGDDLYHPADIRRLVEHPARHAVMGKQVKDPSRFGVFVLKDGNVTSLVEKPQTFISDLANTGAYKFGGEVFEHTLQRSPRGELEVTDFVNYLIGKGQEVGLITVEGYWLPITYPWDVLSAQRYFLSKADIAWRLDPTADVPSSVVLGKNVYVGKNCVIEEEVELEDVCLMDGVHVGAYSRIHGSVIGSNSRVAPDTLVTPHDGAHDLPVANKAPVSVTPAYGGIFTAPDASIEGFIDGPQLLS